MRLSWLANWILAALFCFAAATAHATDHAGGRNFPAGSGGTNAPWQADKPYVVLVSIDGFRWDYQDLYPTPALDRIARQGVRAERLLPVWPTLTFPNHYSLVTGLLPAHHRLVSNDFFDRARGRWYRMKDRETVQDGSFYGGEPIWVTAETQGMVAASFFWVGSEAPVQGLQPSHWQLYDQKVAGEQRVDQVLAWLSAEPAQRPHMLTLYFEEVDSHAHWSGIGSPQMRTAMRDVDRYLSRLLDGIDALPFSEQVYLLVVSDHGQMAYQPGKPFVLDQHIDLDGLQLRDWGNMVWAWQDPPDPAAARRLAERINATWQQGKAYTRETVPAHWQWDDQPRFPDLVFQADAGHAVLTSVAQSRSIKPGDHGWDTDTPEMHGIFLALGPRIVAGQRLGPVRNIDVYPLLLELLGLAAPATPLDGGPMLRDTLLAPAAGQ